MARLVPADEYDALVARVVALEGATKPTIWDHAGTYRRGDEVTMCGNVYRAVVDALPGYFFRFNGVNISHLDWEFVREIPKAPLETFTEEHGRLVVRINGKVAARVELPPKAAPTVSADPSNMLTLGSDGGLYLKGLAGIIEAPLDAKGGIDWHAVKNLAELRILEARSF